jgi:hypothetical protein
MLTRIPFQVRDIIEDHFAPKAAQANEGGQSYSLLLSRIETMMWDRMWGTDEYWEARRHFTFAQELHDRANMFMKLAGLGNGKFLAIHMRCASAHQTARCGLVSGYSKRAKPRHHSA